MEILFLLTGILVFFVDSGISRRSDEELVREIESYEKISNEKYEKYDEILNETYEEAEAIELYSLDASFSIGGNLVLKKNSGFDSSTKVLHFNKHSNEAKCSSKKSCDITAFRISCISDYYDPNESYAGVIIYDAGTYNEGRTSGRIFPGYTMLFKTKNQKTNSAKEGQVHGWAIRKKFGNIIPANKAEVEYMENKFKMKFGGFSVQNGVLKIASGAMNTGEDWHLKLSRRKMGTQETYIIYSLVNFWKTKRQIAVNIPVNQLYLYKPQNLKWTMKNEASNSKSYNLE